VEEYLVPPRPTPLEPNSSRLHPEPGKAADLNPADVERNLAKLAVNFVQYCPWYDLRLRDYHVLIID
jgi:hypothetical protein